MDASINDYDYDYDCVCMYVLLSAKSALMPGQGVGRAGVSESVPISVMRNSIPSK